MIKLHRDKNSPVSKSTIYTSTIVCKFKNSNDHVP